MSQAAHNLAAARAAVVTATERAEAAHAAQSKLLVRKSECEAASVAALADFRAGKINEATASLRKAAADADTGDVAALVAQGAAVLQGLNSAVSQAKSLEKQAEHDFKREEWTLAASELDKQIAQLEQTFLAAHAERARLHKALNPRHNGSTFGYYEHSQALDQLVRRNIAPSI
ncbi:hypothetical protein [Paraburkholderia sediminicola]|uniref:hypothetical protein n=1 Tax=Paraburkholderia sediminicola TaxID=458836 RepID=UPI0038BA426C